MGVEQKIRQWQADRDIPVTEAIPSQKLSEKWEVDQLDSFDDAEEVPADAPPVYPIELGRSRENAEPSAPTWLTKLYNFCSSPYTIVGALASVAGLTYFKSQKDKPQSVFTEHPFKSVAAGAVGLGGLCYTAHVAGKRLGKSRKCDSQNS